MMLLHHFAPHVDPTHALAVGATLPTDTAYLYVAELTGGVRVRGQFQRICEPPDLRRRSGGPEVRGGEGVLYAALSLPNASWFMACPPDRLLNRNVRGFLTGLSRLGQPAHYFGRDVITIAREPVATIAWARDTPTAPVLLEVFIDFARLWPDATASGVAQALADGHAKRFACTVEDTPAPPAAGAPGAPPTTASLIWSDAVAIPIGTLEAGLALDGNAIIDAALAGDFYQDAGAVSALRAALVGQPPDPAILAAAINHVWGRGGHVIEGVRSLQPILEAFLGARERALIVRAPVSM